MTAWGASFSVQLVTYIPSLPYIPDRSQRDKARATIGRHCYGVQPAVCQLMTWHGSAVS